MDPDHHHKALPKGDQLHWYRVDSILGQGGFGITYLATDTNLDQQVAIKEYLPNELAVRVDATTVQPISDDHSRMYRWGLDRFLLEAKTLARFKHPNIVRVQSFFEQNNTAYMVMEYEEGQSLADLVKAGSLRGETNLLKLVEPILDGLEIVHEAGFIHRDIKPDNIFIRRDGSPVLLDFGSARHAISGQTKTLTSLVTPGFAPFEQYHDAEGKQGPWTDIYALGATLYRAIAGKTPMEAIKRGMARINHSTDPYLPLADLKAGEYSEHFLEAIDCALRFLDTDRPQTVGDWRKMLHGEAQIPPETSLSQPTRATSDEVTKVTVPDTVSESPATQPITQAETKRTDTPATIPDGQAQAPPEPQNESAPNRIGLWIGVAVVVVAIGVGGVWTFMGSREQAQVATAPAPASNTSIQTLLKQASDAKDAGNLVRPSGQSALDLYREVLRVDPGNDTATTELVALLERHVSDADRAIAGGDLVRAEMLIEDATQIDPSGNGIAAVKQKLANAHTADRNAASSREETETQTQSDNEIARLLSAAQTSLDSGQLEAAQEAFNAVLRLDANNVQARSGLVSAEKQLLARQREKSIRDTLAQAQRQFDAKQFQSARSSYQSVLKLDADNETAKAGLAKIKTASTPKQYSVAVLPWSLRGADRHEESIFAGLQRALNTRKKQLRITHSHYESLQTGVTSKSLAASGIASADLDSVWVRSSGLFDAPELDKQAALGIAQQLRVDAVLLASVSIAAESGELALYLVERRTGKVRKTEGQAAFRVWGFDQATAQSVEKIVLKVLPARL